MTRRIIARPTGGSSAVRRRKLTDYGGSGSWDGTKDSLNILHQVYRGRYDRFESYRRYEWMDQDSDISRALDLIAEHCSEHDQDNRFFQLNWFTEEPTAELSEMLKAHMDQWSKINRMDKHLFKIVRNTLKYGDWFMFRNPNTFELYDIHPMDVLSAIVDRDTMDILGWVVRDFRWNIEDLEIDVDRRELDQHMKQFSNLGTTASNTGMNARAIPAIHMIQFSMSEGKIASSSSNMNSPNRYTNPWPFGNSWLDKAHKTFKQRELIEDAALIHRVQRAPSRHVWYIDTGKMRHDRSKYVIQNFKNELNQKRIPQFIGEDNRSVDSVYNPLSQLEDYYIPVSMDQRGSKVEQLEGTPWSDMPDLEYFKKKMLSALRVPYAWLLPSGEGGITPQDGRSGVATQEEIEFSRFCSRIHTFLIEPLDHEFKLYCRWRDVNANWADFNLNFIPPTDYEASKERTRLEAAAQTFSALSNYAFLSKRLLMRKALGWTEDEIAENERMVDEEQMRGMGAAQDDGGMGGGFGGGLPPMGGDMGGIDGEGGLEANADGYTSAGGAMGGMDMGPGMGGGMDAGGMGAAESTKRKDKNMLFEDEIQLPSPKRDMSGLARTPDDASVGSNDPIKGKPVATLSMIQRIRHAHFTKRVDWQTRLKRLGRIYSGPAEGGGPPGLGGF